MSKENKLIQCNFQYHNDMGDIFCALKARTLGKSTLFCDQEKCRLVDITTTVKEIHRLLMNEYMKETP